MMTKSIFSKRTIKIPDDILQGSQKYKSMKIFGHNSYKTHIKMPIQKKIYHLLRSITPVSALKKISLELNQFVDPHLKCGENMSKCRNEKKKKREHDI